MKQPRPNSCYVQGPCVICGVNKQKSKGTSGKYRLQCATCLNKKRGKSDKRKPWQAHKGGNCELCGFVPVHPCQLDVDHIDGDKNNCSVENYQTLCANCHRLKTFLNRDWE